jgi:hypothetical protein
VTGNTYPRVWSCLSGRRGRQRLPPSGDGLRSNAPVRPCSRLRSCSRSSRPRR